jgi:hypothetical protein
VCLLLNGPMGDDYLDENDGDDEEPTVPCPYCKREILEDVVRCPYCENYLSTEDAPPAPKPWWILLGVVLVLLVVYLWFF